MVWYRLCTLYGSVVNGIIRPSAAYIALYCSSPVVGGVSILTLDLGEFAGVHRYNLLMDSDGSMLYIAVDSTKGTITHTDEKQYRFLYQDVSSDQ